MLVPLCQEVFRLLLASMALTAASLDLLLGVQSHHSRAIASTLMELSWRGLGIQRILVTEPKQRCTKAAGAL